MFDMLDAAVQCRADMTLVMEPFLILCLLFETLLMLHPGEGGVPL